MRRYNSDDPLSLKRSYSRADLPNAKYPRLIRRFYAGKLQWCIQTKRIYTVASYQHGAPPIEHIRLDLLPLNDPRPHWSTVKPRKKPKWYSRQS